MLYCVQERRGKVYEHRLRDIKSYLNVSPHLDLGLEQRPTITQDLRFVTECFEDFSVLKTLNRTTVVGNHGTTIQ